MATIILQKLELKAKYIHLKVNIDNKTRKACFTLSLGCFLAGRGAVLLVLMGNVWNLDMCVLSASLGLLQQPDS